MFLDESRLAVAFTKGTDPEGTGIANVSRRYAAVLDPALSGPVESFELPPARDPYAGLPALAQSAPSAEQCAHPYRRVARRSVDRGPRRSDDTWRFHQAFAPTSGRYVELTMKGTTSGIADLLELMIYPSSQVLPASVAASVDRLDLTYLTGMSAALNPNMGTGASRFSLGHRCGRPTRQIARPRRHWRRRGHHRSRTNVHDFRSRSRLLGQST